MACSANQLAAATTLLLALVVSLQGVTLGARSLHSRDLLMDFPISCSVKLGGGLDPIAGKTDLTLSHNCLNGYAQTITVAGELVDFYRSTQKKCIFSGDTVLLTPGDQWCITMQDGGGFNIGGLLQVSGKPGDPDLGLSTRVDCHPSSLTNLNCEWPLNIAPGANGGQPSIEVVVAG